MEKSWHCIECGTGISRGHKRCKRCAISGKFNPHYGKKGSKHPFYGKHHTEEHKKRMSLLKKNKPRPEMLREQNPNWRGGKSFYPYPLGWTRTFKEQIRYRDGYKCRKCGMTEEENGRRLDVHHIDFNKINLSEDNLISLCVHCHRKTYKKGLL